MTGQEQMGHDPQASGHKAAFAAASFLGAADGGGDGGDGGDGGGSGKGGVLACPDGSAEAQESVPSEKEGGALLDSREDYASLSVPPDLPLDDRLFGEFKNLAASLGLGSEQAQQLVDLQAESVLRQMEQFQEQRRAWVDELVTDKEFGGTHLQRTLEDAKTVLEHYNPSGALLSELEKSGYGDNPEIIRLLASIGRDLREDTVLQAKEGGMRRKIPLRDRLWPDELMPS